MFQPIEFLCRATPVFLLLSLCLLQGCAGQSAEPQRLAKNLTSSPANLQTEARAAAEKILRGLFDRLDCDMDGTIEQGEIDEHFSQIWLPTDSDASQTLSVREYVLISGSLSETQRSTTFNAADANADGLVSARELRTYLFGLIELLDDNGDFELSRADLGMPATL